MKSFTLLFAAVFICSTSWAKIEVGSQAADKYFKKRQSSKQVQSRKQMSPRNASHYLALHLGSFVDDKAYNWGSDTHKDIGGMSLGMSYRVGEWVDSSDLLIRVDFASYDLNQGHSTKMSFLPMVTFPDAKSMFPLYFGAGIGPGVFFKQIEGESSLALDYQLVAGGRFFNVINSIGLTFEAGIKNHINILSDGQFNGVFVTAGSVFVF